MDFRRQKPALPLGSVGNHGCRNPAKALAEKWIARDIAAQAVQA
jgi:hypothetical protein